MTSHAVINLPRNMQTKIATEGEHWVWTGAKNSRGYGCIGVYGKSQLAHRIAWELLVGPIPDGYVIDHVVARGCGRHDCVNPEHLEPVTSLENIRRGLGPSKTHCPAGHEYTGANLVVRVRKNGQINRACRACQQATAKTCRAKPKPALSSDDGRHGTVTGYTYYACRCELCREANRNRLRAWRDRQSEPAA